MYSASDHHKQFEKRSLRTAGNQAFTYPTKTVGQSIPNPFPTLFNSMGNIEGHYSIKLKPGVKSFACTHPGSYPYH